MAYVGDHFRNDVHFGGSFQPNGGLKWDSIAVVEEMWRFDESSSEGRDPQLIDNSRYWGHNFFYDQQSVGGSESLVKNYFVGEIEKVARYAVPFAKNLKSLIR